MRLRQLQILDERLVVQWVIISQAKFTKKNMITARKSQPLLLIDYNIFTGCELLWLLG